MAGRQADLTATRGGQRRLGGAQRVQGGAAAGLCALGLQLRPRDLVAGGARPALLAVAATLCAVLTALAGVLVLPVG